MDNEIAELHELLRGGPYRVKGALLGADGTPLHAAQEGSLLAAGFGFAALAAFAAPTRVTAVRLTAEVVEQPEGADQPTVRTVEADVPLPVPVDVPAGVPVLAILPDAPDLSPPFVPGQPVEEAPPAIQAEAPRSARNRRAAIEQPQPEPAPAVPGDPAPQS